MFNFIIQITIWLSISGLTMLAIHRWLLPFVGPRTLYTLWILLPAGSLILFVGPELGKLIDIPTILNLPEIRALEVISTASENIGSSWYKALTLATVITWFAGSFIMIGVAALENYRLYHLPRSSYKGLVRLHLPKNNSPALSGWIKPRLLLPDDFETRYSLPQRRLIIQHEIQHWRRKDIQCNWIAWILLSTQWFNPIIWLSYRRFRADQEMACDADVMGRYPEAISMQVCYANTLLATIQSASFHPPSATRSLTPGSTCYGNHPHNGAFIMIQQRLNHLRKPKTFSAVPASILTLGLLTASLLWYAPAHSTEAAETLEPIVRINPSYPTSAVEEAITGYVDFSFTVTTRGEVENIEIIKSQPAGVFDENATWALSRWRYPPQDKHVQQNIRLSFTLDTAE